jgi:hypothetical protein
MRKSPCFLLFLLLVSPLLQAAVTVSVDRNPVHVNESFQLLFEADETPDGDPDFSALRQHFAILNTSQNSSISLINGNYQRSIKWTLQLMPKQAGEFVVPAIRFGDDKTDPFQVSVKPAAQSDQASGQGLIFELYADRESVAVQGQLIVTMRLMSDTNISAYEFGELMIDNVDVVTEPLGDVKRFQTRLGDKAYLVLEQKFALFPQNSGEMEINPVLGQVRLSSASNSVFDPFQRRGEIRSVNSPPLNIKVTGIDPAFTGKHWLPATKLRLSEVWQSDLDNLVAGEPITRTIMLVAEGLTAAQLPPLEQEQVSGIKQYPDQASLDDQRSDKGIVGVRQQKVALIPTAGGRYKLPEIRLPWWNTETARQEVATIPSRTIMVAAAAESPQVPSESTIIPELAPQPGAVQTLNRQQSNHFWVWLSLFLACGWFASALAWWWRYHRADRQHSEKDAGQIRLKQAAKRLKSACEANNALEARDALLLWAGALPVGKKFNHLNQLADYFGEPVKTQIDTMNKSIYAATKQDWQGHELWQTCRNIMRDIEPSASINEHSLPALNP